MQFWTQYHDQIIAALGFVAANILTPLIRKIPAANIVLVILRALLSGVPTETIKGPTTTKDVTTTTLVSLVALVFALGCAPKYSFVSAKDSEGDSYQFCFKATGAALSFTGRAMGCADVESQTAQQEQAFLAAHPGAKTVRVRQLKVAAQ